MQVILAQSELYAEDYPIESGHSLISHIAMVIVCLSAALGISLLLCLPFFIWRRTRRHAWIAATLLFLIQIVLGIVFGIFAGVFNKEEILFPLLVFSLFPYLIVFWRRTRRLMVILLGLGIISFLAFGNYMTWVISSIGFILLMLALWPCWKLLKSAPRPREEASVVPSRGPLTSRPWPACRKPEQGGFTLVSALVGVMCLVIAFAISTQIISGTMAALRRADHMAMATDLLESAREKSLAGLEPGNIMASAARLLPHGAASINKARAQDGLTRLTATATWKEATGKPGKVVLEWLAAEKAK